jgi:hypothetical protein
MRWRTLRNPHQLHAEGVRRYASTSFLRVRRKTPAGRARGRGRAGDRRPSRSGSDAIKAGKSVESTMGFTRSIARHGNTPGQLDPGVVLYLTPKRAFASKVQDFLIAIAA